MRKKETKFIERLVKKLPSSVFHWKIHAAFANGTPDSWFSDDKGDLWVEFKWVDEAILGVEAGATALQRYWLNQRHKEGRNVAIIVGSPTGVALLRNEEWNRPIESFDLSIQDTATWISNEVKHEREALYRSTPHSKTIRRSKLPVLPYNPLHSSREAHTVKSSTSSER